jgi:hypothetical protein
MLRGKEDRDKRNGKSWVCRGGRKVFEGICFNDTKEHKIVR